MRYRSQLNVQQQNRLTEDSIRKEAIYWRKNGTPTALQIAGREKGINWERSIIIDMDIDFSGMPSLFGLLLSQDECLFKFEIETDEAHKVLKEVVLWEQVTATQNLSLHNPGTGAGRGALAIKVLRELNA